jgi:hypothetical protein
MAKPRGRPFTPGNTASRGRPPGSRNQHTVWSEELIGQYREAVLRKCLAMALQGDSTAMRLCVERILPISKESRIRLKMAKVNTMAEVATAWNQVLQAVGRGEITPEQGQRLADLLQGRGRIIESEEMEARLRVLERVSGVNPKL